MGEIIKSRWKRLVDYMKDIGVVGAGLSVIATVLIYIGGQLTYFTKTFKEYKETVPLVKQLVSDLKVIQDDFKTQESYRKTVDELKVYAISEIDWEINDTKYRIQNDLPLGFSYIQRLEYYEENISFLTLEQKKDIKFIKNYFYNHTKKERD